MHEEELWSGHITVAEAFRVMQFYLQSHRDVIVSSEDIGWFVTHVSVEGDPAHEREWLDAVNKVRSNDAH